MSEHPTALEAMGRAGRRVVYHLLQAAVEGLKALEAIIEEIGAIGNESDDHGEQPLERIEIE